MADMVEDMRSLIREIRESNRRRSDDRNSRTERVRELTAETRTSLDESHEARERSAAERRRRRREQIEELSGKVDAVIDEVREGLEENRELLEQASHESRRERNSAVEQSRVDVDQLAEAVREDLARYREKLAEDGAEDAADRRDTLTVIRESVSALRSDVRDDCAEFSEDLRSVRGILDPGEGRSIGADPTEQPSDWEPESTPSAEQSVPVETRPVDPVSLDADDAEGAGSGTGVGDRTSSISASSADITDIVGIGPSTSEVLQESDVETLQDVATATPGELREALDELAPYSNVEHWIEQAEKLLQEHSDG